MKNMRAFFILMLLVQLGVTSYAKNISKFSVVEDHEMKPRRMYKSMQSINALDYWNKMLGAVVMPSLLRDMISLLSTVAVNEYKEMIEKNIFFSNDKLTSTFCTSANLLCRSLDDQNLEIIANNLFRIFYYRAYVGVASTPAIKSHSNELENFSWFYEKDMFLNITKVYPKNLFNIESKAIQRSFLPRTLAAAFGNLSSNSAKFLIEAFNISNSSILAKLIYETAALCEEEATVGEIKLCIQSVEDLVDLTKQMLDPSSEFDPVEVLSGISRLPAPKNVDNKEWKIVKVEPKGDIKSKYISCHSAIFLYQVYVCHYIPKTKIFSVSLESVPIGYTKLEVIVLCHTDTSMWDPNHIAFRVLGGKPGTTSICHWSSYDALVFVKHNNAANI